MDLRDQFHRLTHSALAWADAGLTEPAMVHDADCRKTRGGRCTCRTALDRLAAGTVVVVLTSQDQASLVRPDGCQAVWVEKSVLERCRDPGLDQVDDAVPLDYRQWIEQQAQGVKFCNSRKKPQGGSLVFVRGDDDPQPWRYVGHVRQDGLLCALLVDGSVPVHLVFDQDRTRVRTVPMKGDDPSSVLRAMVTR